MSTIVLENGDAIQKSGQNDSTGTATGTEIEPIIRIYCKGADNVIFERFKKRYGSNIVESYEATFIHVCGRWVAYVSDRYCNHSD